MLMLTLFVTLTTLSLSAQVITYNKTLIYSENSRDEACNGVVELNGRYFVSAFISDEEGEKIGIAEIDSVGNKIWSATIGDSVHYYWGSRINKSSDGNLIMTGMYQNTQDSSFFYPRTIVVKFSQDGELKWIRSVNDSMFPKKWTFGKQVIETSDKGFAIIGQISIMGIVYKTDSLCNLQWYKTYGTGHTDWYEYMDNIQELSDSSLLMGSCWNRALSQEGDPILTRLDKNGAFLWRQFIGSPLPDRSPFPLQLNDSVIIALAPYTTKATSHGDEQEIKLRILKLTLGTGELISDTMYGDTDFLYTIEQIRQLSDSTFIACGSDLYARAVWLFGFSEEGDSLFLRYYKSDPYGNDHSSPMNGGGVICGDGGILMPGAYLGESKDKDGHWHGWLLKTDRYGCFEMGCDSNAIYILDQPDPASFCRDQDGSLSITTYPGKISYHWHTLTDGKWGDISDTNIYSGVESQDLTIDLSKLNLKNYWYRCRVFNSYFDLTTDSAKITILDTLCIISQPDDRLVRRWDTASFIISVNGESPMIYQWFKGDHAIQDEVGDTLVIAQITSADTGVYFCRVNNPCGTEDSRFAKLSINYTSIEPLSVNPCKVFYPNPAKDKITIEAAAGHLSLLNLTGRDVLTREITEPKTVIDISTLHQGIYIVKLSGEKSIQVGKLIKN